MLFFLVKFPLQYVGSLSPVLFFCLHSLGFLKASYTSYKCKIENNLAYTEEINSNEMDRI